MGGPGAFAISVPVLKWFVRNRGRALAFMSLGVPLGAMVFVPLTQYLIDVVGWEMAWIILAVIGMDVIVPLAAIFVRRQPEDMGLLPDGDTELVSLESDPAERSAAPAEVSWTASEAVRTTTAVEAGGSVQLSFTGYRHG